MCGSQPHELYSEPWPCMLAGEARTKAMAEAAGAADDEDFAFDSFADPGGLIMSTIIEKHLKDAPNKNRLLERAKALKLPGNPLVSSTVSLLGSVFVLSSRAARQSSGEQHCQLVGSRSHDEYIAFRCRASLQRLAQQATFCICPFRMGGSSTL